MTIVNDQDFFIQWRLTTRCNLSCRGCPLHELDSSELTLQEVARGVSNIMASLEGWRRKFRLSFTPCFLLGGGEPLVRDDIFEIIRMMRRQGVVRLLSNGAMIDRRTACRLAEGGVDDVQINLDGEAKIHDEICGEGSFHAAVDGIRRLIAAGVAVTINMTLSRRNAHCVPDMVALAGNLGVRRLGFSRYSPPGNGHLLPVFMLDKEEMVEIYRSLFTVSIPDLEIVTGDPMAAQIHASGGNTRGKLPFGGCAAGISGLTILADGTITPCRRLDIPLGNIGTDSIDMIWTTSAVLARLRDRNNYSGKCGRCELWSDCRGCRGVAYAWSRANGGHDFLGEDPQCSLHIE